MFNLVQWYKFDIDGKKAVIAATSVLAAISIIENEGHTNYSFVGIVD